jgi:hypothetical protein
MLSRVFSESSRLGARLSEKRALGVPRGVPPQPYRWGKNARSLYFPCSSSHSTALRPLTPACVKQADQGKRRDPAPVNAAHFQLVNPSLTMVVSSRRLATCKAALRRSECRFAAAANARQG